MHHHKLLLNDVTLMPDEYEEVINSAMNIDEFIAIANTAFRK